MFLLKNSGLLIVTLVILAGFFCPASLAEQSGNLTYDDILKMNYLHQFILTADEKNLVYFITEGDDLAPPGDNATLMMIETSTGKNTVLSSPDESVTEWSVSPDGIRVAYASMPRNGGESSLYIIDISTLYKVKKTEAPGELLSGFAFAGSDHLVYLGAYPNTTKDNKPGSVIVMDAIPDPVILKSYDIGSGTITNLTNNSDVIYEYMPSPDGKYVVYKSSVYPEVWLTDPVFRYYMLDVVIGTEDEIMTRVEGYEDENELVWSPDSSVAYIERNINGGIHYPIRYSSDIVTYTPATKTLEEVPLQWKRTLHVDTFNADVEITPFNGGVYALLADGTNPKLAKYARNATGWEMTMLKGEHQGNIFALDTTDDGKTLYYNYNTPTVPPQIYHAEVSGDSINKPVQITSLNTELLVKQLGTSEVIEWQGANNDTIKGILRYPPGYVPGTPYPLVFVVHGGPTYTDFDSWRDTWEFPYHLITDTGVITLSVNYHGSSNFGFDFAKSIEGGNYYKLPVEDFNKAIDYLSEKGVIDKNKVATTGWSNGGFLNLGWITMYDGLKAAVAGAGSADENSEDAYINGIIMNKMYYDNTPFVDPESYIPIKGVYNADKVNTPLLMFQGTKDFSVVPPSAVTTYRAYKMGSKTDVEMIIFKDEPHHLEIYSNQLRKVTEEINWLTSHLFLESNKTN